MIDVKNLFLAAMFLASPCWALLSPEEPAQLVVENSRVICEKFVFHKDLPLYKDPYAWDLDEPSNLVRQRPTGYKNPLYTTLRGPVQLMRPGKVRQVPRSLFGRYFRPGVRGKSELVAAFPVQICEKGGYHDALGLVLEEDFVNAQKDDSHQGQLAPSVNSIPILRE